MQSKYLSVNWVPIKWIWERNKGVTTRDGMGSFCVSYWLATINKFFPSVVWHYFGYFLYGLTIKALHVWLRVPFHSIKVRTTMYFSRVNTYTVSKGLYSGDEQHCQGRVPDILCCTWQSTAWPRRDCLSVMLCSTGQGMPQQLSSSSYGLCWRQKPVLSPTACSWRSHKICRCHGIIPLLCSTHGKCC